MTDHAWLDAAAPYALGALAAEERAAFEAHLADCAVCRADVQALGEVSGLLAHAAAAATPRPALRERILREARAVRPLAAGGRGLPWLAVAAAVVLAVAAGVAYLKERGSRQMLERAVAVARDSLAAQQQLVATLLAPDVNTAVLASKGRPPTARVFWNPSRHRVVMAVFDLPPAPAGRIYQLWAIQTGKAPVSLGIFNTAPDGRVTTALDVPPALVAFDVTAVTEEPAGGSPQPTQQPFLVGKLQGGE